MEVKTAEFVKSSSSLEECPQMELPEYAFIGRSNVGKSSLINMLVGNRKLAKVSGKPGKTQLINHFLVDGSWFLVDLPGYGWATVSKKEKARWEIMTANYFKGRANLTCVFVLVDSRLEPQPIDIEFINALGTRGIPIGIILTKTDKLGLNKSHSNASRLKKDLLKSWQEIPPLFFSSAINGYGRDEILAYINEINSGIS